MVKSTTLNIRSFNARGLADGKKRRTVFQWLKDSHPGIVLLQETHSTPAMEKTWKRDWNGEIVFSHGTNNSRGTAILIPNHHTVNTSIIDNEGRIVLSQITYEEQELIVMNIYAPTKDKREEQLTFLDTVKDILNQFIDKNIVMGGDFNVCIDPAIDKKGGNKEKPSAFATEIKLILDEFNLTDIWRVLNPNTKKYTWKGNTRKGKVSSRLDYFFISTHLIYDLESTDIKPSIKSDHNIIELNFFIRESDKKGRGFWKFNSSLLKDEEYIKIVKSTIQECKVKYKDMKNLALKWDAIKCEIRSATISHSSFISKKQKQEVTHLSQKLLYFENKMHENPDPSTEKEYIETKQKLEKIYEEKILRYFYKIQSKMDRRF